MKGKKAVITTREKARAIEVGLSNQPRRLRITEGQVKTISDMAKQTKKK